MRPTGFRFSGSESAANGSTSITVPSSSMVSRRLGEAGTDGRVMLFDVQDDVEADLVHQPERRDAGLGEDLPHAVDVLRRCDPFLDHHQALALDRRPDAVEDEPVALSLDAWTDQSNS
jgi:hypothetical protein